MESSPLAAMQPPPLPPAWGCRRDLLAPPRPRQSATGSAANLFGTGSFNFKDMSMVRSHSDYFTSRPVRGSSPAASLAADLSQNFHIDQSPQLPTPRRSLFTSANVFQRSNVRDGATTPPIRWEGVTTPPVPSSSPGFGGDMMDMSPLPHKAPFVRTAATRVPTPETQSTVDEAMSSPPVMTSDSAATSQDSQDSASSLFERRKPALPRPSLARTSKFFSTNTVAQAARGPDNQLPPFKFGAGVEAPGAPSLSLDDIEDSPEARRGSLDASIVLQSRPRNLFASGSFANRMNGSPIGGLSKKGSCPVQRPRKQFRRSISMYEHPGDVMKQDKKEFAECGLQSIMDVDDTHKQVLPHHFPTDSRDGLPRISQETMLDVLDGKYKAHFAQTFVVDCRFEYEFQGGHVEGAINRNDKKSLTDELFRVEKPQNTLLILHCEFSAHRAPLMAEHIRREDRRANESNYPHLTYPEVYILEGGYHTFFQQHAGRCFPQAYTAMNAVGHEDSCEREMDKLRAQRGKLSRAKTYAFGQSVLLQSQQITLQHQESPTAGIQRSGSTGAVPQRFGGLAGSERHGISRRMASY